MPLLNDSKINASFKKLLGKSHTDNNKEVGNEALSSFVQASSGTTFGQDVPPVPTMGALYATTSGVVEWVRLEAVPDASANGHAFILQLPTGYVGNSTNPLVGTGAWTNGNPLSATSGKVQIVPTLYGLDYEPKPYRGGSAIQGSGTLVPPGDVADWNLDTASGVLFQENDPNTNPTDIAYVECFIYIGDMVSDVLGGTANTADIPVTEANANIANTTGTIDFIPVVDVSIAKWIVSADDGAGNMYMCEVTGANDGTNADHQEDHIFEFPSNGALDFQVGIDVVGGNMRLRGTTTATSVNLDVTRLVVRLA